MSNRNKFDRQGNINNQRNSPPPLVNHGQSDKITPEIKQRLDDALRRLNSAAEDIREIRRFLQTAQERL